MTSNFSPKQSTSSHDPGPFARLFLRVYAQLDAVRFMAEPSSNVRGAWWVLIQWIVVVSALPFAVAASIFNRPFSFWGFVAVLAAMYILAEIDIRAHEDDRSHDSQLMARYGTMLERIKIFLILAVPLPVVVYLIVFT